MKKKIGTVSFRKKNWVVQGFEPEPKRFQRKPSTNCIAQLVENLRRNRLGPGSNPELRKNVKIGYKKEKKEEHVCLFFRAAIFNFNYFPNKIILHLQNQANCKILLSCT